MLVICCCVTNYPTLEVETTFIISVSVGQDRGLAGYLCFKASHNAAVKVSSGAVAKCEDLPGRETTSKLTHVIVGRYRPLTGCGTDGLSSFLARGQSFSVPRHEDLFTGQVTAWQVASLRGSKGVGKGGPRRRPQSLFN